MRYGKLFRILFSSALIIICIVAINYIISEDKRIKSQVLYNKNQHHIFLKDNEFSTIVSDGEYIYTGGLQGAFKIDEASYEIEELMFGEKSYSLVRAIVFDEKDNLWIGHENGLTKTKDNQILQHYDMADGLPDNRVNDIEINGERIFVATFSGVAIIDNDDIRIFNEDNGLLKDITKTILLDSKGNLWCGSYTILGGGITLYSDFQSNQPPLYLGVNDGLNHPAITSITETKEGDVWVGNGSYTLGGATLFTFVDGIWMEKESISKEDGLIGEKVRFIYIDNYEDIWFCSENDGISIRAKNGEMMYMTSDSGLSDNEIKCITMDSQDNIWLASRFGITRIDKECIKSLFTY